MVRSRLETFERIRRKHGLRHATSVAGVHALARVPRHGIPYYYRFRAALNWRLSGDFVYRPEPFKLVSVPPDEIQYITLDRLSYKRNKYAKAGTVTDGDWDQSTALFGDVTVVPSEEPENTILRSFRLRFEGGYEWKETPFVQRALQKVAEGEACWHGCTSRADVTRRCERMDRLFGEMKTHGYRSRRQIVEETEPDVTNPERFHRVYDEVVVNVGRDGELLFVDGKHRLSLAKILQIEEIPVRLLVRHKQWQQTIDRLFLSDDGGLEHPDLEELA